MLKRFLKFLKGDPEQEDFEGSYLDHLLAKVRVVAEQQLDHCPEHDPLLLVVANILRMTMPGRFEEPLEGPLFDAQSPPLPPPSPDAEPTADAEPEGADAPPPAPDAEPVATDDADDAEDAEDAELAELAEAGGDAPDGDEIVEIDGDDIVEESQADEASAEADSEAEGVQPLGAEVAMPAEVVARDAAQPAEVGDRLTEPMDAVSHQIKLSSPDVLQAGRVFLGMLIENDRLPVPMQLSVEETHLARDLLLGYFVKNADFEPKARQLLTIVERKFSEGAFSQARILLQLFQTDRSTQVNNHRNLFYEDMIVRMGIRRRHPIAQADLKAELAARVDEADDLDVALNAAFLWLAERLHVQMHLFARDSEAIEHWEELARRSSRVDAVDALLRFLPPRRWRPAPNFPTPPTEVACAHISRNTVRRYIVSQLKACYFVLRAVGDTGLEAYLDSFFDWSQSRWDVNAVQLMPVIYRRSMSETQLIDEVFEDIYRSFYRRKVGEFLDELSDETVVASLQDTLDAFGEFNFNEIAPGHYDMGGFVLDELLGMTYPRPEFAFKLHRLT